MGLLFFQLVNVSDRILYGKGNTYERQGILNVLRYIESNYRMATLQEAAHMQNVSIHQMSRFIKKNTGHKKFTIN